MGLDIKREKRSSRKLGIHLYSSNIERNESDKRVYTEGKRQQRSCGVQRKRKKRVVKTSESYLTEANEGGICARGRVIYNTRYHTVDESDTEGV